MRCDQCKHWGTQSADELDFCVCRAFPLVSSLMQANERLDYRPMGKGYPYVDEKRERALDKFRALKAFTEDAADYYAVLRTRADFFCACFEPKTE